MTFPAHPTQPEPASGRGSIEEQAADWLSRRDQGFQPGEQERFSAWLLADPRHAAAAEELEAVWRLLQKPKFTGQSEDVMREIDARVQRRRSRQRVGWWSATVFAAAAAAAVVVTTSVSRRPENVPLQVVAGTVQMKPDRQTLPDGSVVELKAGAEIATDFTPTTRNVRLLRGTGLFTVQKDPARPFVVQADGVSVRAVGTEFCVRFDPAEIDVLVTEGRVAVERPGSANAETAPANSSSSSSVVNAGQHAALPVRDLRATFEVRSASASLIQAALAWRTKRVEFTDVPLRELVRLFNQSNPVQLDVAPDAADVRISGIYWLDDPEGVARLIESVAGLKAVQQGSRRILLQRP